MYKIVFGHILNPLSDTKCETFKNGAMVLKKTSKAGRVIYKVHEVGKRNSIVRKYENFEAVDLSDQVIMPAFFDMHFHWVQDDVREMPKTSLLEWLDKYTFPAERKFQSKKYSKQKAKYFFNRLAKAGTLGGACYSSIHEHAVEDAFDHVVGDFVIGNVLMTMNSPKFLTQTKKEAVSVVKRLAKKYKKRYALTPRFAIATDEETMSETSKIAKQHGCFLQSHLSETKNEIEFVKSLYLHKSQFKKVNSYTGIYHKVGMLGPRTIMGHGIHLGAEDLELLQKTNTAIAHCPTSNAPIREKGLGSGLFNFKLVEKNKIRWALASDIGGGPFLSMLDVMQSFVRQNQKAKVKGATFIKALYRSTLAGAEILKVDKRCGNLATGKEANFVVLKAPKNIAELKAEQILEKIVLKNVKSRKNYDAQISEVYYQGHQLDI